MSHEKILLLHPVLRPNGFDYHDNCEFEMVISDSRRTAEGMVRVDISYNLKSCTLSEMVERGKAKFLVMSKCTRTLYRRAVSSDTPNTLLEISSSDLAGALRLTPYIVASDDLEWFSSDEHVDEIKAITDGGRIPCGSVLAVGPSHEIEMDDIGTIKSAIKIIRNENMKEGQYALDTLEDSVVIELGYKTYTDIAHMRAHTRTLLYPSIYLAAVEYAIRKMGDNSGRKWAKALQKILDDHEIKGEKIEDDPNHCAQEILDNPLGQLIRWYDEGAAIGH